MKIVQFEGTPDEFEAVSHIFQGDDGEPAPNSGGMNGVDPVDAVREVLTRRPVSDGQRVVFKALSEGPLEYEKFLEKADRTSSQMAGVLGALGRRISNTPSIKRSGLPANAYAMIHYRRDGADLYLSLTPHAEEALKEEGII